jgi:hypothetical protein
MKRHRVEPNNQTIETQIKRICVDPSSWCPPWPNAFLHRRFELSTHSRCASTSTSSASRPGNRLRAGFAPELNESKAPSVTRAPSRVHQPAPSPISPNTTSTTFTHKPRSSRTHRRIFGARIQAVVGFWDGFGRERGGIRFVCAREFRCVIVVQISSSVAGRVEAGFGMGESGKVVVCYRDRNLGGKGVEASRC